MAFLFLPLSILVIDTGLVEAAYAQLGETLQASAEDGASTLDESAFRSDGKTIRLDPAAARSVVDRSMNISQLQGLDSWSVTVVGNTCGCRKLGTRAIRSGRRRYGRAKVQPGRAD
jgi:hypothetical protein